MNNLFPVFPPTVGTFVEFEKDGRQYRLQHAIEGMWVVHQRDVAAEDFELVISNRSAGYIDVEGRGHMGQISALGATERILLDSGIL